MNNGENEPTKREKSRRTRKKNGTKYKKRQITNEFIYFRNAEITGETKSGVKQRIVSREPEILYEGGFDRWTRRRVSIAIKRNSAKKSF